MASEYTKGPYFVTEDGFIRVLEGEHRLYIANMVNIPHKDGGEKATNANANLLAASYELLEALKFAKEVIDDQAERFHKECRCQLCESLPMMIDAAIAKAEATNGY
jgi:hypothetical protein